jgi:mannosyltransferase OCH1-like enzyme
MYTIIILIILLLIFFFFKNVLLHDSKCFIKKNNFYYINKEIPKIIHLTYKTKNIPQSIINKWTEIYPEYDIKIYDNNDCINFLYKEFGQEYVDIFNFIKDGPIKADFWRLCILYKYGGIYSDIDIIPNINIEEILLPDTTFLTCICSFFKNISPQFIVSIPEHIVLKLCIDEYLEFYRTNKTYKYRSWSIMRIMKPILCNILEDCVNNDDVYYDNNNNTYQFLKEKANFKFEDLLTLKIIDKIKNLGRGMHCEYNKKIILYNKNDNYSNHKFN